MTTDEVYADLIRTCLDGERVQTRNAECFRRIHWSVTFDRTPLVGLRKTPWKTALREFEWFLSGSSNIALLHESARDWWRPWADFQSGQVAFNYSHQFRRYNGRFDQIEHLIRGVRDHPFSRRNVITTWHAEEMAQPWCPITNCHHSLTCASVDGGNRLSLLTVQRSADVIVGLPANWIQTWAFLLWLARRTGRGVGTLTWVGHDNHVYSAHEEVARRILAVADAPPTPELVYAPTSEDFLAADFSLSGDYRPVLTERVEMVK